MAENTKSNAASEKLNGMFVRGVVVSSSARVFNRKDGSGKIVCVRHELALQPGLAIFEEYPELNAGKVKLDGDKVVEFPRLPEMQQVTLKVLRWEERDKHLVIKEAQMVA
jgi:hypothetical protein